MTTIHKFKSVGDWEALYVGGEIQDENHIGRVNVLDHLEPGMEIEDVVSCRVNLPEGDTCYPSTIDEVVERDDYEYDE